MTEHADAQWELPPGLLGRLRCGGQDAWGLGVCAGWARATGTPVVAWRAAFVLLTLWRPWLMLVYLVLGALMPAPKASERSGLPWRALGRRVGRLFGYQSTRASHD